MRSRILLLLVLFVAAPAQAAPCESEAQIEAMRAQDSLLAARVNAPDREQRAFLWLLSQNAVLECQLGVQERFWTSVREVLGGPTTFVSALAEILSLTQLRTEVEEVTRQRQLGFSDGVPLRADLLVKEFIELRRRAQTAEDALERAQQRAIATHQTLEKATLEILEVARYQAEIQRLRNDVAQLQAEKAAAATAAATLPPPAPAPAQPRPTRRSKIAQRP
jgi:hypothetical protein